MNNSSSELSFAELLEQFQPRKMPVYGQIERGEIQSLTPNGAWIRIGGCKTEVFAPTNELDETSQRIGEPVIFKVTDDKNENAPIQVSCKKAADWRLAFTAQEAGLPVKVRVISVKRTGKKISGVRVHFGENRTFGFIPFTLLSVRPSDVDSLLDRELEADVERIDFEQGSLTFNRKSLEDRLRAERELKIDAITIGGIHESVPILAIAKKDANEYGLFVEVGGVRGLVYRTEIPEARKGNLSSRFKVGDVVDVVVQAVNPAMGNTGRTVSLSMKAYNMRQFCRQVKPGDMLVGTVESRVQYGAFIALPAGMDGLLHKNEFQPHRAELRLDEEVKVRVISIDAANGRIELSMRKIAG